ncbi:DEAD/DEAH box helicase family protein [Vibrio alginolyticus]
MEYFYKNISGATEFKNIKLHVTKNENDIITSTNTRDDLTMKLPSEVLSTIPVYQNRVSSIAIYASTSVQDMIDAIATSIHFKKELLISGHSIDSLNMIPLLQEVYLISHACRLTDNNSELIEHALKQLKQAVHSAFVSIESAIFFASTLFNISSHEIVRQLTSINEQEVEAIKLSLDFSSAKQVSCLNQIELALNRVNVISAETGVGKTTYVIDHYLRQRLKANPNLKIATISHKDAINSNMNNKISKLLPHAKQASHNTQSLEKLENAQLIVSTTNSLPKMLQYVLRCDLVIFDESEKGFISIDGSHYNSDLLKANSFDAIRTVITDAKHVIMMDADSTNCITGQLIASTGIKDYQLYKVEGGRYSDINITITNRDEVLNEIGGGHNPYKVMAFDKKEALYQYLFSMGFQSSGKGCAEKALEAGYLVITADTRNKDAVKKFLANPNDSCFLYKKILYSPYIDSAVSIEANYTDKVLVVSHSILMPKELIQMGRRFRQAKEIIFAVQKDHVTCYQNKNMNTNGEPLNKSFSFEYMQHLIHHISTHTRHNMPLSLQRTAESLGFRVKIKECSPSQRYRESLLQKQITEAYKASVNESIYKAPEHVSNLNEANQVIHSGQANNLQLCAAEKRVISERLCIPMDSLTNEAISFSRDQASLLEHLQKYMEWRTTKTPYNELYELIDIIFKTLEISIDNINQNQSITTSNYYHAYDVINQILNSNSKLCKKLSSMKTMLKPITCKSQSKSYRTRAINDFLSKLGFDCQRDYKTNNKYRKYNISLNPNAYPSVLYVYHRDVTSLDSLHSNMQSFSSI